MSSRRLTGFFATILAIAFNIPYSILAATFDYPGILRQPVATVLERFAAGGPALVLAWFGFMLTALALVPVSIALAITPQRLQQAPGLAIGAAISGALAGIAQAIGLSRWVFVIPSLATAHVAAVANDTARIGIEQAFMVLNLYGGVAIGEHLGQLLTAMFVVMLALLQRQERQARLAILGGITAAALVIGTGEGLAISLGHDGSQFSLFTIGGFLGLSLWLVAAGVPLMRRR